MDRARQDLSFQDDIMREALFVHPVLGGMDRLDNDMICPFQRVIHEQRYVRIYTLRQRALCHDAEPAYRSLCTLRALSCH